MKNSYLLDNCCGTCKNTDCSGCSTGKKKLKTQTFTHVNEEKSGEDSKCS